MLQGEHAEKKSSKVLNFILSLAVMIALVWGLSVALRTFVIDMYYIPSGSMEKTIMTGDYVMGEKISYRFGEPQVGDIVVFTNPSLESQNLIKRVVATEGQIVNFSDGKLVVDGVTQDEPYTNGRASLPASSSDVEISYPYTVPKGCVFVMGDNRTNSRDSRFIGAIEVSTIQSKAVLVYFPFSDFKTL